MAARLVAITLAGLSCLALSVAPARADLIVSSLQRNLFTSADADTTDMTPPRTNTQSATDTTTPTLDSASSDGGTDPFNPVAVAKTNQSLMTDVLQINGGGGGSSSGVAGARVATGNPNARAFNNSDFTVNFTVNQPSPFTFNGTILAATTDASGGNPVATSDFTPGVNGAFFRLTQNGADVFSINTSNQSGPFATTGTFQPATNYQLTGGSFATATAADPNRVSNYTFVLQTVPAPEPST